MVFIIGVLITLTAGVIVVSVRASERLNAGPLGWMSEQWLAEYRFSHQS